MGIPDVPIFFGKQKMLGSSLFARKIKNTTMAGLFDLILYAPVNNFSVMSDGTSWVEPVLSKDKCVLLKDTTQ